MPDVNQIAHSIVAMATGQTEGKNQAAVALGLLGGAKGGKARAAGMSKTERSKAASKAAKARWKQKKRDDR